MLQLIRQCTEIYPEDYTADDLEDILYYLGLTYSMADPRVANDRGYMCGVRQRARVMI